MPRIFLFICLLISFFAEAQKKRVPGRMINDPERLKALSILDSLGTITPSTFWPNIKPADFLQNLRRNLEQPYQMNTGRNTSFCAFGAVSFTCLKNEPVRYVQCMIDLYRKGEGFYRNIRLAPPEAVRLAAGKMIFQGDLDICPADQAWYLSLAHRFKGYLNFFNRNYQPGDENNMWAATNLAKFNRMLRKLCKYQLKSKGSDLIRPSVPKLPEFLQEKLAQGEVYLYLNNSVFRKKNHNRLQKWIPTHYVVLMEIYPGQNGNWVVKYWDGGYKTLKEVSVRSLKQITYGITWVSYNTTSDE